GQSVRVADLVLEAEADQVKLGERSERFQAVKRKRMPAEECLEVEARSESPLASPLRVVVHDGVQHLQAVVAHAERVGVGESETELAADLAVILDHAAE